MLTSKHTHSDQTCNCRRRESRYYAELARISAWLFIGVLALMTFLLTVGLQHPQKMFSTFFYFSLTLLPLNLIIYVVSNMMQQRLDASPAGMVVEAKAKKSDSDSDDKDDSSDKADESVASDAPAAKSAKSSGLLSWVRALQMVQQLVFILSLLAVTGLALVSAHIFFAPPTAAPQTEQGQ